MPVEMAVPVSLAVEVPSGLLFASEPTSAISEGDELIVSYIARAFPDHIICIVTITNTLRVAITEVSLTRIRQQGAIKPDSATRSEEIAAGANGVITLKFPEVSIAQCYSDCLPVRKLNTNTNYRMGHISKCLHS
jgi:hypothetical protein